MVFLCSYASVVRIQWMGVAVSPDVDACWLEFRMDIPCLYPCEYLLLCWCIIHFRFGIFEHTSWKWTCRATRMRYLVALTKSSWSSIILLYCWLLSIKRELRRWCMWWLLGVHRWLESGRWKGGVWWQGSGPQAMDELTTGVYIAARDWSIMHTYAYKYLGKKAPVGVMALCTVDDIYDLAM